MPHLQGVKGMGCEKETQSQSLIMDNKHASQSRGRRGLDLGKQKGWIVVCRVCSRLELVEAAWPVSNAGNLAL